MSQGTPQQWCLLTSRLSIPLARPQLVPRPRLLKQLDEGLAHKCTLVCAPAGSGKTTLLAAWARSSSQQGIPVAWLSLEDSDNDPRRFWSYFVAALQTIQTDIGSEILSLLHSSQPPPYDTLLVMLMNALAAIPQTIALVLNDYHVIDTPALHHALTVLLDHLPAHVHLFIAGRSDPPLPLARLRARNELLELRAEELRFTEEEAADFLRQTMDLALPDQVIAALESRTEGWVAGLQLMALSLKGHEDTNSLLTTFTTSPFPHRHIADYLIQEVLEQQPEPVRTFLLHTCILNRLTSALCQALSETTGAQEMLRLLEQRNIFLVPLDEQRIWYRYHQLFANVLRHYVRETTPELLPTLHRRASDWYEQQSDYPEAIDHAIDATDVERAAELIEKLCEATNWQYSEYARLRKWLQALPATVIQARLPLCVLYASSIVLSYPLDADQREAAEEYLRHAQRSLASGKESPGQYDHARRQAIEGAIAANLSALVRIRGEIAAAREYAFQALAMLPRKKIVYRDLAARTLVNIYLNHGDTEAANRALEEFALLGGTAQDSFVVLNALTSMATIQTLRGELLQAFATYQEIIRRAEQKLKQWQPLWSYMGLGGILLEWNALDEAESYLMRALEIAGKTDNLDALFNSYQQLLLLYWARGDIKHAAACIDNIELILLKAPHFAQNLFNNVCKALRAWLALACGDLAAARRWAQSYQHANDIDAEQFTQTRMAELIILVRVYLANTMPATALQLLERLLPIAEKMQRTHNIIWILILQALALSAQGNTKRAIATLLRALELAEPGGYIRIFVNEGAPVAALLSQALEALQATGSSIEQRVSVEYVRALLAALEQQTPAKKKAEKPLYSQENPATLSKREREVVYLMSLGLSDREIAQRLVLTENTIKTHAKRIYARLDVKNRAQAVTQARELGLF
jgi:LuxR family maltose regulon positive regulatory protein